MDALRAMSSVQPGRGHPTRLLETQTEKVVDGRTSARSRARSPSGRRLSPVQRQGGEVILESGHKITKNAAETICTWA